MKKYKQRADGRYFTQVSTGKFDDNGKPIKINLYAKSSRELEKLVTNAKYEIEHGTYAHDKGLTFREYADKWLEVSKASRGIRTKAMYDNILKNHIGILENMKLKSIVKSDIQLQINKSADFPRTCEQIRMTLHQILESAVEDGLITKNPCKNIELPRKVTKEKRALTDMEKKALKNADLTTMEKAFIYTLYGCGLRPGELYALTKNDIDIKKNEITISKALVFDKTKPIVTYPKTNSGIRTIQAPNFVFNALADWTNENHNLIIFCDENGQYRTRSGYYYVFNKIIGKMKKTTGEDGKIHELKINGLSQYTFRHNYCTELYYAGVSLKETQRLMGHADYSMIMKVYSHLDAKKENTKTKLESLAL